MHKMLRAYRAGKVPENQVLDAIRKLPYQELGFAKLDTHRAIRKGFGEVVFCQSKTAEQVLKIVEQMNKNMSNILLTRVKSETAKQVLKRFKHADYNSTAKTIVIWKQKREQKGHILIVTAGTSDIPVAEEAQVTAEVMGSSVEMLHDVGVAGLHRILKNMDKLEKPNVIIVVAGMEGALASVVGGLTSKPIIAVPTSVGYGAHFQGLAPLLSMLNSCSPGIAVVNIDNGFGAGYFASLINR